MFFVQRPIEKKAQVVFISRVRVIVAIQRHIPPRWVNEPFSPLIVTCGLRRQHKHFLITLLYIDRKKEEIFGGGYGT